MNVARGQLIDTLVIDEHNGRLVFIYNCFAEDLLVQSLSRVR